MAFKLFKPAPQTEPLRKTLRQRVYEKTDGHCWYTGKRLDPNNFHIDHLVPRKLGGSDELDNLVPTSPDYNIWKSADPLEVVREREIQQKRDRSRILKHRHKNHSFWFERKKLM